MILCRCGSCVSDLCCTMLRAATTFDPGITVTSSRRPARSVSLCLLIMTLAISMIPSCTAAAGKCRLERCNLEFQRVWKRHSLSASPSTCVALNRYRVCLHSTQRACRGNLAFHSSELVVRRQFAQLQCPAVLRKAASDALADGITTPSSISTTQLDMAARDSLATSTDGHSGACSGVGHSPDAVYCALFGDPHVRTFSGRFQTCRVRGAWPLINTRYLAVQVTSDLAGSLTDQSSRVTALTKITVLVKPMTPCTDQLTYEADSSHLPAAFVDGSRHSDGSTTPAVRLRVLQRNNHVQLELHHVNATLVLRRTHSGHLTFAARLPADWGRESGDGSELSLCVHGCPADEQVDRDHALQARSSSISARSTEGGSHAASRDQVALVCRRRELTDFFLDACVFDAVTSGRLAYVESAVLAQRDFSQLMPEQAALMPGRTQLLFTSRTSSAAAAHTIVSLTPSTTAVWTVIMLYTARGLWR